MIYWYRNLWMDDTVAKHPKRCKRRVESRRPWKKSYYVLMLAVNEKNLFEIVETRQLFFRRYNNIDCYVIALTKNYNNAVDILSCFLEREYCRDPFFQPRDYFRKPDFVKAKKQGK